MTSEARLPTIVPTPVKAKPRLGYTRKRGWVVLEPGLSDGSWRIRGGAAGAAVWEGDVLAWADLPPVPDEAA
jgi:hypothetical protein